MKPNNIYGIVAIDGCVEQKEVQMASSAEDAYKIAKEMVCKALAGG